MSGRQPVCEDSVAISARLAELRAERMRAIAGCTCPQRSTTGEVVHTSLCPLGPTPPSHMQLTLEAMARARARLRQAGVPIREEAAVGDLLGRVRMDCKELVKLVEAAIQRAPP